MLQGEAALGVREVEVAEGDVERALGQGGAPELPDLEAYLNDPCGIVTDRDLGGN